MRNQILVAITGIILSACNYSNTFVGKYNDQDATLSAYSKNINKYCVALTLKSGGETKHESFVSAESVFDSNDYFKTKTFNTKDAPCSQGLDEYLVGTRSVTLLSTGYISRTERMTYNTNYCRSAVYKTYTFHENIDLEFKKNTDDQTTGKFTGKGQVDTLVDEDHVVNYGPIYYCGVVYPRPFPRYRY